MTLLQITNARLADKLRRAVQLPPEQEKRGAVCPMGNLGK